MRLDVAFTAALALATAGPCAGAGRPAEEPFVAGELIVKFAPGSPVERALAGGSGELSGNAALAEGLANLSREAGVPLVARQLTSGGELLLALDREALVEETLGRLRENPNVTRAERQAQAETILPSPREELRVDLRPGSEAARLALTAGREGGAQPPALRALASLLLPDHPARPTARLAGGAEVVLTLDLGALTLDLASRLRERPDVVTVELNRLAEAYALPEG